MFEYNQERLIHRIVATNTFLYKIHYAKSNTCTFCSTEPETLSYLFYDCQIVKNKSSVRKTHCHFVSWLTINIKHYIYRMKVQKQKVNIKAIKNILQKQFQITKYILFKSCEYNLFIKYWTPWQNALFTEVCVTTKKKRGEKPFL